MKVHHSTLAFSSNTPTVVTIGTYDGVHLGHKSILKKVTEIARNSNLESVLLTFFPHPRMVLQKDNQLQLLNTLEEKQILLEQTGLNHLVIHPFTRDFSRLTAVEYVRDILVNQLHAKKIVIGYDHRFGRNRNANIEQLREFAPTYEFTVEEISVKELDEVAISSTKIRNALLEGDIITANSFLGYPYFAKGVITKGKGIGKSLGYPTANLKIDNSHKLIPKNGVYITKAVIENNTFFGMTNIGNNPTVGGKETTIETFFLDYTGNLYNKTIVLSFIEKIRDQHHFEGVEQLKEAIKKDEIFTRNFLK